MLPIVAESFQTDALDGLAQAILKLAASNLADLRTYELPFAEGVSERPKASLLARRMVQEGSVVTTLLHTHLNIEDEKGIKFLQLLDGTRDVPALTEALAADSLNESPEIIRRQVEENLVNFHRMGLLLA